MHLQHLEAWAVNFFSERGQALLRCDFEDMVYAIVEKADDLEAKTRKVN